jgi:hypothetical protein
MNSGIKFYFVVNETFHNVTMLEKMIYLITKEHLVMEKSGRLIKVEEIDIKVFNKIVVSLKTLAHDLDEEELALIIVPFYEKIFSLDFAFKTDVYFLASLLLKQNQLGILDLDKINNFFKHIPENIYQSVHTYLSFNRSLYLTGEMMFTHRNTINYRINKFINLTNVDLHDEASAQVIYIMMELKENNNYGKEC